MNSRRMIIVLTLWIVAAFVVVMVFFGPTLLSGLSQGAGSSQTLQPAPTPANAVVAENANVGSSNWQIDPANESVYQIQAYADATSVAPGGAITFYVSVDQGVDPGPSFTIDIYRLGWYGGAGARLMTTIPNNPAAFQGWYGVSTQVLKCPSCLGIDKKTGLLDAHWNPSYKLAVPSDWTSGVYLAKFTDAKGMQTYAPFDVTGSPTSTYVVVTPDATAQAENVWGGASLSQVDPKGIQHDNGVPVSPNAGVPQVSFNRPYADGIGSGQVLTYELPTIRWLESQGYDVSYISSTDLDQHPEQLLKHKAVLSIGKDEYWSKNMRDGYTRARDNGIGVAFLGAHTGFWQVRFDNNDRTITCYKVLAGNPNVAPLLSDYTRDPNYSALPGADNTSVTTQWRDPLLKQSENALTGVMFSELSNSQAGFAWTVDPKADTPLFAHTGLKPGQGYGCGIVGNEWDRLYNRSNDDPTFQAATPKNLVVLSTSTTQIDDGNTKGADVSNSVYYIAASGALVFSSGSTSWGNALDNFRSINTALTATPAEKAYQARLVASCNNGANSSQAVPEIQALMANLMNVLAVKHPSGHL